VETNFVQLDAGALGLDADDAAARLHAEGVLLSFAARHGVLRAVTHLDVSADDIEEAVERIPRALTGAAAPAHRRRRADALLGDKPLLRPPRREGREKPQFIPRRGLI
jgi:hypothetical protein